MRDNLADLASLQADCRSITGRVFQTIIVHPKAAKDVKGSVGAPMPGEVLEVKVKVGERVHKGQPVVIMSAMKMEMVVQAPLDGVVKNIAAEKGMKLQGDDLLMDIEA